MATEPSDINNQLPDNVIDLRADFAQRRFEGLRMNAAEAQIVSARRRLGERAISKIVDYFGPASEVRQAGVVTQPKPGTVDSKNIEPGSRS